MTAVYNRNMSSSSSDLSRKNFSLPYVVIFGDFLLLIRSVRKCSVVTHILKFYKKMRWKIHFRCCYLEVKNLIQIILLFRLHQFRHVFISILYFIVLFVEGAFFLHQNNPFHLPSLPKYIKLRVWCHLKLVP